MSRASATPRFATSQIIAIITGIRRYAIGYFSRPAAARPGRSPAGLPARLIHRFSTATGRPFTSQLPGPS
jgi:hypothetical protein